MARKLVLLLLLCLAWSCSSRSIVGAVPSTVPQTIARGLEPWLEARSPGAKWFTKGSGQSTSSEGGLFDPYVRFRANYDAEGDVPAPERAALLADLRAVLVSVAARAGATSISGPAVVRPAGQEEIEYALPGRQGQITIVFLETATGRLQINVNVTEDTENMTTAVSVSPVTSK